VLTIETESPSRICLPKKAAPLDECDHQPDIVAAELGKYLAYSEDGRHGLRAAIRDDIGANSLRALLGTPHSTMLKSTSVIMWDCGKGAVTTLPNIATGGVATPYQLASNRLSLAAIAT
jgi:hypothetical protein